MPNIETTDEKELERIVRSARTIAILGMKDGRDAGSPAYEIPKMLHERGYKVIPVNPKLKGALGEPALPDLAHLGRRVDILDVFRRSEFVAAHTDEILALPLEQRPAVVWMQSGIRDDESAARLAAVGISVVMDRCLGVYASRYGPPPVPARACE